MTMFLTLGAMATRIPVLMTNTDETETPRVLDVKFESFAPRNFELTVTDKNGEIVFYKKSERPSDNYSGAINFNGLKDGEYHLNLDFGDCSINRDVLVSKYKVQSGEISSKCAPYFQVEKNSIRISHFNKEQKNLFLNVYQNGKLIDGKKLGNDLCLQKYVDISRLKRGTYNVILSDSSNHECSFTLHK